MKSIIVGVDGTDNGMRAVDYAVAEARRMGVGVCLMHVAPHQLLSAIPLPHAAQCAMIDAGHRFVEDAAVRARTAGLAEHLIQTRVVTGSPAAELLDASHLASGVVLAHRALHGHERWFTGSTTLAVAARAHCPVHVVPTSWRADSARALEQDGVPHSVVGVGIDTSASAVSVLAAAFAEAVTRRAELRVRYAWKPAMYNFAGVADWQDAMAEVARQAESRIAETLAAFVEKFPEVKVTSEYVHDHPAPALIDLSDRVSVLVLGSRDGSESDGLGAVSRAVLDATHAPVILVGHHAVAASSVTVTARPLASGRRPAMVPGS